MTTTISFSVRTRLLAAVAKWAYQHEDRPNLERVLFDGLHMVACDGHRLVVVPCVTGLPAFALRRRDCAALAAAQRELGKGSRAEIAFASVVDRRATIWLDDVGACAMIVRAGNVDDFPPWQKLFENLKAETPTPPEYAFEPRYLAEIDEVIEAEEGGGSRGQRTVAIKAWTAIEPSGYCGPMLFETPESGIRFLIMAKRR